MPEPTEEETRAMVRGLSKALGREVISLVEAAVAVGWKVHIVDPRNLTLIPPGPGRRLHFNAHGKHVSPKRLYATVMRYGDKAKVEALTKLAHNTEADDPAFHAAVTAMAALNVDANEGSIRVDTPEPPKPKPPRRRAVLTPPTPKAKPTPPQPVRTPEAPVPARRVVHEAPLLMHYSLSARGGRSYPSPTTLVRKYSDGTEVYACRVPTCDREVPATQENRRSMGGAHWGMHVRRGEAEAVDQTQFKGMAVEDPDYTEHAGTRISNGRRASKVAALARFFASLDDISNLSAKDLAEMVVEHLARQGGMTEGEAAELTDEQVLDRIRRLVDRGQYVEQQSRIEILELDLQTALDTASKAEARANDLQAKIDLLREAIGIDEDGAA